MALLVPLTIELQPCPFCGDKSPIVGIVMLKAELYAAMVRCTAERCAAYGPQCRAPSMEEAEANARRAWNIRAVW